jgi:hypothetical protein
VLQIRFRNLILLSMSCALLAQEPMNNDGVIKLVKSGMTEDLIINVIQQQPGMYSMSANDLVALKEASVSEKIISAMLAKGRGEPAAPTVGGAPAGSAKLLAPSGRASISGPGVFYKKGNEYFELLTEDVDWKTSGAMKNIVSAGIVKKDLNGTLAGPSSRNFLTNPTEIVLSPPGGMTVNAYILLPMKLNKGLREFNVGPVNQKSGVAKGAIAFGVEKIGENVFRMVFPTPLGPGEYGILSATPSESSTGTSKMYTFRVLL